MGFLRIFLHYVWYFKHLFKKTPNKAKNFTRFRFDSQSIWNQMLGMPQRTFTETNIDYQGWCLSNINFSIIYPIFPKSFGEEFEINEVQHRCSKRCVFLVYQRSICSLQSRLDSSSFIPPFQKLKWREAIYSLSILINLSPLFSSTTLPPPFI